MKRQLIKRLTTMVRVLLLAAVFQLSAYAASSHQYQLPDGTQVTMTVQSNQTVLTLAGVPGDKFYRLDATEDLAQWTTLDLKFKLSNQGVYTYIDSRRLAKCFYRIVAL